MGRGNETMALAGPLPRERGRSVLVMNVARLFRVVMIASPVVLTAWTPTEWRTSMKPMMTSSVPLPIEGELPSLDIGGEWLNSPPLSPASLRGKVVLLDIWNFSCINWIRQLPYVRAWAEKYKDHGLVVIGVHSPEFGFETDVDNVRRAARAMNVAYPIVMDSQHAIWRALDNQAWPALYFVDAGGHIRHHYYGEGAYDQAEEILQQLLAEAGRAGGPQELVSIDPKGVEEQADWRSLRTPETYVGYERAENFASPGGPLEDKPADYTAPAKLGLNHWALSGRWSMGQEAAVLKAPHGRITFRFHARDLHLVMGSAAAGASVRFRVLIDGRPPEGSHGLDVDGQGNGTATEDRLYQLIRQPGPIQDRTFEIEFLDAGVEILSFTFG
jgi:thiol-disulfide isomerase/thioredoxin